MLVLLPPSEGKTAPQVGEPLDLAALSGGRAVRGHRRRVLDALVRTSRQPDGAAVLGVPVTLGDEVRRNARLRSAPTAPAAHVYSGVLYAAARLADLEPGARERAARAVRVVSALWGVVGPWDPIPAYRLSMGTDLPGVGPLARSWRGPLGAELDTSVRGRLVVDCRSAAYAAAWTPPPAAHHVTVGVLREIAGVRTVVSHAAKHTRGVLTRHLVTRDGAEPRTSDELLDAARELVGGELRAVELVPARTGHELRLVV